MPGMLNTDFCIIRRMLRKVASVPSRPRELSSDSLAEETENTSAIRLAVAQININILHLFEVSIQEQFRHNFLLSEPPKNTKP